MKLFLLVAAIICWFIAALSVIFSGHFLISPLEWFLIGAPLFAASFLPLPS